jgi:hypothetical protein
VVRTYLGIAVALVLSVLSASGHAETPYYQGKQIRILVGFSPGGGTDLVGRVFAERLGRYIDGKPTVLVQNMPGAGSVVASNYFVQRAPRDGTVLLVGTGQLLMRIMLGLDGSKAKLGDVEALVASPMGRIAYAGPSTGIHSAKDILNPREPLILGVPEVIATIDAVLGLKVLNANFRPVMGYPGKNDTRLALERNEVNVDGQTTPIYETNVRPLVKSGKAVPLFAQGLMDGDALVRDPAAPDVPTVAEVYREIHGADPSGPAWDAYKAMVRAVGNGGKILMTHSDTPPEARAALKRAVETMTKDPEFLKAAETLLEGYGLNTGRELEASLNAISAMTPETIAWLQDLLSREYGMKFN